VSDDLAPALAYNYLALAERDAYAAATVRSAATAIKDALAKSSKEMILVGRQLAIAKGKLDHGEWLPWLEAEFGWSEWTARRWINLAETYGNRALVPDTTMKALYLLASPDTPEEARAEVDKLAGSGPVKTETVKEVVRRAKAKKTPRSQAVGTEEGGQTQATVLDLPTDLDLVRGKLAGLAELARTLDQQRKHAQGLLRAYTKDDDVKLAAACLPSVIEDLGDLIMVLQRQCYPEGLCPICHGERVTASGMCTTCRGGGWANRNMLTKK
jgi:hypothetical protein